MIIRIRWAAWLAAGTSLLLGQAQSTTPQKSNPAIQTPSMSRSAQQSAAQTPSPSLIASGQSLFLQDCAFCHGKDAGGGETGPDLTRSRLVRGDVSGDKIGDVVRNGRPDKGMPAFTLTVPEISGISAFIHDQIRKGGSRPGGRKGVDPSDLQTGNVEAGKQYFNGAGNCASCHSPSGDLAGVASRYQGLQLEQRLLYPRDAKAKATITPSSGQPITGTLAYRDEFTIAVIDSSGRYHSWPTSQVKSKIDAPADAHAELLAKYSDDDIHNLMAYLQTLR